ncbi:hypothetical protein Ciccas_011243 [Cichlidogyrus casuarinus]|uniref:Uncharacterized protein n=1 Tax=Cichlidogyrus casuarinus TaxID=1844966 RepID=A0ABD2PSM3_9PLAT
MGTCWLDNTIKGKKASYWVIERGIFACPALINSAFRGRLAYVVSPGLRHSLSLTRTAPQKNADYNSSPHPNKRINGPLVVGAMLPKKAAPHFNDKWKIGCLCLSRPPVP